MLQQDIIRLCGIIWVQLLSALKSELEGDPDYSTHSLTYEFLCLFTNINVCKSCIEPKSNDYDSIVMDIRNILCLQEAQYEPTEAYYRRFEASISTSDLEQCTAMTHVELNNTYMEGNDYNVTKRFQATCLLMSANYEK